MLDGQRQVIGPVCQEVVDTVRQLQTLKSSADAMFLSSVGKGLQRAVQALADRPPLTPVLGDNMSFQPDACILSVGLGGVYTGRPGIPTVPTVAAQSDDSITIAWDDAVPPPVQPGSPLTTSAAASAASASLATPNTTPAGGGGGGSGRGVTIVPAAGYVVQRRDATADASTFATVYTGPTKQFRDEKVSPSEVYVYRVASTANSCPQSAWCADSPPLSCVPPIDVTFTTLGCEGAKGPTSVGGHYDQEPLLNGLVTLTADGYQQWTVPRTGTYSIETLGAGAPKQTAQPGNAVASKGARMRADYQLQQGDVLLILVGQPPKVDHYHGGAGGTWMRYTACVCVGVCCNLSLVSCTQVCFCVPLL